MTNRLKQPLDRLCREFDWTLRVKQDAIQFPLRYSDPADIELAGLFASCMAYGRVDLFGPWVDWTLQRMGESPARFVLGFDVRSRVAAPFRLCHRDPHMNPAPRRRTATVPAVASFSPTTAM